MLMNVLITGALGWLGKALTEVVGAEHNVRAFDLASVHSAREHVEFKGEVVYGSVTDFDSVRAAMKGQNAVIHAAIDNTRGDHYRPGSAQPFLVNVQGTYNVLEAARQEGVGRVILIASAETHVDYPPGTFLDGDTPYYGLPGNIYDLTKHLQEKVCAWFARHHDMNIIALRLGDILDLKRGLTKWDPAYWRRSMETDSWIDRYDVGRACLRALELKHQGFEAFHLVGAPSAKDRFDVERTRRVLGIELTTDFDQRHSTERE